MCISNVSIIHTHIQLLLQYSINWSVITSIIVYCIMKNKGNKQQQRGGAAIYDLPIIDKQQQQDISTHTNTAYGHIN